MVHKEFKMLVIGDHVEYSGKGVDRGNEGDVVDIIGEDILVKGDHGVVWYNGDIQDSSSFKQSTYKFWRFVHH